MQRGAEVLLVMLASVNLQNVWGPTCLAMPLRFYVLALTGPSLRQAPALAPREQQDEQARG